MGWSIGYDETWQRDIGYGVPAWCDHPDCTEKIDRGLSYVCCDQQPYGGDEGCGLYFCSAHSNVNGLCECCEQGVTPFEAKPDHPAWIEWKLTHASWADWRAANAELVKVLQSS